MTDTAVSSPQPNATNSIWTDDRVSELRKLWALGKSAQDIAGDMDLTRNQVIGKVTRLGLVNPEGKKNGRPPNDDGVEIRPEPYLVAPCDVVPLRISLIELREDHCRWPYDPKDDEPAVVYCGHDRKRGAFCASHASVAYLQPEQRKRRAA